MSTKDIKTLTSWFIVFLSLLGCKSKSLPADAYLEYCVDTNNTIKTSKTMGQVKLDLVYQPADLVILQRSRSAVLTMRTLDSLRKSYDTLQFYTLTLENMMGHSEPIKAQGDTQLYSDFINYFSFQAQRDIKLLQNGDTLDCILYHFERSYSLAPKNKINLAFKNKGKGDRMLVYDDQAFGLGRTYLTIKQKMIDDFPKLEIEQK